MVDSLNPDRIISNYKETVTSFEDLKLKDDILQCLYKNGYAFPSSIQSKAILPLLQGKDTIAQGQAGSGKTAAFVIPALQKIDPNIKKPQVLILVPTRELALQIKDLVIKLGEYLRYSVQSCIGGTGLRSEVERLKKNSQIIVGTPGRVLDHLKRGSLDVKSLKLMILDEADDLLGKNFQETVKGVFQAVPTDIQVGLFFTTMGLKCLETTRNFMRDPVVILCKYKELLMEEIKQYYFEIEEEADRLDVLIELLENIDERCIIYCNKRHRVEELAFRLKEKFDLITLHGYIAQDTRYSLLKDFKAGSHRILITTDSMTRGLDMQKVPLVINFDTPVNTDEYIQRVGRVGKFGRGGGVAITFVGETKFVESLKKYCDSNITELPLDLGTIFD